MEISWKIKMFNINLNVDAKKIQIILSLMLFSSKIKTVKCLAWKET